MKFSWLHKPEFFTQKGSILTRFLQELFDFLSQNDLIIHTS